MTVKKNVTETNVPAAQHPDYRAEVAGIVRSNLTPKRMREELLSHHENDVAAALELLKKEERGRLYSVLDAESLSGVLEHAEERQKYIGELGARKKVEVLSRLEAPVAAEYLAGVDRAEREALLELMDEEVRQGIALLSSFDEDEIGSQMSTNYIVIRFPCTVREAMRELVAQAADNDNISTLYVVDGEEALLGAIDLKDLIVARENTALESILMTSYPYVYATEQTGECIERIRGYSEDSIPVLDPQNRLRGVLTAQDIARLVGDEMGEDYARLAGLTAEEDLKEPLKKSIAKRLPWLVVLLGLGIVVSAVVGLFEEVVAHLALVVCFQSLILDMAGNVGTQSLAVTIRVLMDEQVSGREKLALVGKEARVGLTNGCILGLLSFLLVGLYLMVLKGQSAALSFSVSLCTGVALLAAMLLASVTGTVIPILFKKLRIDPAVASGPLITTLNDLAAVVVYYGAAWLLLIRVLGL
ncbi:MAG: magnesium transporter [Oscillospiraceae bacterium]